MSTSPVSREAGAAEPETKVLAGRRALVTGGTRGMGAAIAELLVARGAHVIVTARHREDSEPPVRLIQADLASPGGGDFVAGEATRILGGLDIVGAFLLGRLVCYAQVFVSGEQNVTSG